MTQNQVFQAVRSAIMVPRGMNIDTDVYVIEANQPKPIPAAGQYITLEVFEPVRIGQDTKTYVDDTGSVETLTEIVAGDREARVSCNIYRGDVSDTAQRVSMYLESTAGNFELNRRNIFLVDVGDAVNINAVLGTGTEPRRQLDITVRYRLQHRLVVERLAGISMPGAVVHEAGETQIDAIRASLN